MQMFNIFRRELYGYFNSPVAYIFLVIFIGLSTFLAFVNGFYEMREANLKAFFHFHPFIYLVFAPAIAMRLWSEERMSGTIQLLLTLPITVKEAVIAKFLAAWLFMGIALLLTFPMVITVHKLGNPDDWVIITSYIGSFLMAGAYLAVGSLTSAITKNQVISFVLSVFFCFCILLPSLPDFMEFAKKLFSQEVADFIAAFGFWVHFESIQQGVLDLSDLFYFLSLIALLLYANVLAVDAKKAS